MINLKKLLLICILFPLSVLIQSHKEEEGMFPLSALSKLDLKKEGLRLSPKELYNPEGVSLIDAIVRIGGCTGSFVSEDGLIITNHHCAFGAVAGISDTAHDYIAKGYLARTRKEEAVANGLTVKITASYEDVSEKVLAASTLMDDPDMRMKMISGRIQEVIAEEKKKTPDLQCEISEMFTGKVYVLFRYKIIKDVRLVYVPQRNIGEYGGENDNWVWPRHSGDFAFVRAYVGPDGSAAAYSEKNIPYKPARYLKINPKGVKESDFAFILGYPGTTFRHQPSQFFEYHQKYQLAFTSEVYDWQISKMEEIGKQDKQWGINYSARIKTLANVAKNYKGKIQGFRRIPLVQNKKKEEQEIQQFINADPQLQAQYGSLLKNIDAIYAEKFKDAGKLLWLRSMTSTPGLFKAAICWNNFSREMKAMEKLKWKKAITFLTPEIKSKMVEAYGSYNKSFDRDFFKMMFRRALKDPSFGIFANIREVYQDENIEQAADDYADKLIDKTHLNNPTKVYEYLDKNPEKLFGFNDELLRFSDAVNKLYIEVEGARMRQDAKLSQLLANLLDVKMKWKSTSFIPDANATLRFTFGHIKGYSPADGEYQAPFTTMAGLIEKSDNTVYVLPDGYREYERQKDFDSFAMEELNDLPIDILYDMDTTGGNSGSPVMNADGELIGVNFDRAFTATINDYAWNENYSRSVGVDIRYILWVVKKMAGANFLLEEMKVI
jgi:hypothetical protein